MRKILVNSALTLLGITGFAQSEAQSLPPVYVTGSYAWGGGFGGGFDFGPQVGGSPFPEYPAMVAAIEQHRSLINVRCSGGAYRDVTSHSDQVLRQLAAETIFRVIKQPQTLWRKIFRSAPYENGILLVIYADGGQEQFEVTNPAFTSAMPGGPMPGTLKMGSGQIQPHYICG